MAELAEAIAAFQPAFGSYVEDEPATEEMNVKVTLTEDEIVEMPAMSPSVEFTFENLTETITLSTYVVAVKGASVTDAIETKTQDVFAGTKYATIGLYSATFAEAGTYYVYYKVGNGDWCEEPLIITVTEPVEPTVKWDAGYTVGTVGTLISESVTVTLENDSFKQEIAEFTDVTEWFTGMPENWKATVKWDVDAGDTEMTIDIVCETPVAGSGFIGMTIPADQLTSGSSLTTPTFAYKVEVTE